MTSKQSIGFFDSGIGGTTIWKEVVQLMPNENTLLIADSANAPYGEKSKETIIKLSEKNTEFLLSKGCKIIIVACNTATTNAISHLRNKYPSMPFIGIEPAIKPAALQSKTKKVGVLATQGTLSSELFLRTSQDSIVQNDVEIVEIVGHGLAGLVEQGHTDSPEIVRLLEEYLTPLISIGIDTLVLGCTHYPYLIPVMSTILPADIQVIDSGYAVAQQTRRVLQQFGLLCESNEQPLHQWITNGNSEVLKKFAPDIPTVEIREQLF